MLVPAADWSDGALSDGLQETVLWSVTNIPDSFLTTLAKQTERIRLAVYRFFAVGLSPEQVNAVEKQLDSGEFVEEFSRGH